MANNPYLSRMRKEAEQHGVLENFDRMLNERRPADAEKYPTKEVLQQIFNDLGLELPKMGAKKLTEEEKKEIQKQNENALLDIFRNGLPEEKKQLMEIVSKHEIKVNKQAQITAIKNAKAKLRRLGMTAEQINEL